MRGEGKHALSRKVVTIFDRMLMFQIINNNIKYHRDVVACIPEKLTLPDNRRHDSVIAFSDVSGYVTTC